MLVIGIQGELQGATVIIHPINLGRVCRYTIGRQLTSDILLRRST